MSTLADKLGIDLSSPTQRRAITLEENDARFIQELIALRRRLGLTQQDVADRLGVAQSTIAAFERYDNDPKLSTVRRYAHAVGALVHHAVEEDRGDVTGYEGWPADAVVNITMRRQQRLATRSGWSEHIA
jgi:transcriptional regulator with XRE-family HTH domain